MWRVSSTLGAVRDNTRFSGSKSLKSLERFTAKEKAAAVSVSGIRTVRQTPASTICAYVKVELTTALWPPEDGSCSAMAPS